MSSGSFFYGPDVAAAARVLSVVTALRRGAAPSDSSAPPARALLAPGVVTASCLVVSLGVWQPMHTSVNSPSLTPSVTGR